jgi:hypothetical protein
LTAHWRKGSNPVRRILDIPATCRLAPLLATFSMPRP